MEKQIIKRKKYYVGDLVQYIAPTGPIVCLLLKEFSSSVFVSVVVEFGENSTIEFSTIDEVYIRTYKLNKKYLNYKLRDVSVYNIIGLIKRPCANCEENANQI